MNSRTSNVLLLCFIGGLERFSYYGMRAVFIFFLLDEFEFSSEDVLGYYSWLAIFIGLVALPAGLVSDFKLKQKNGILVGGITATFGYGLLITEQLQLVIVGMLLIIIAVGFIKVNFPVLIGRLFKKHEKERDFGFLVSYTAINLGAFFGIFCIGIYAEEYGHKYGFMIATAVSLFYTVLFYFTQSRFELIEGNEKLEVSINENDAILDAELTTKIDTKIHPPTFSLIAIFMAFTFLFWSTYSFGVEIYHNKIQAIDEFKFMGFNLSQSLASGLESYFIFPILILFLITWNFIVKKSTWYKLAFGIFLVIFGSILMYLLIGQIELSGELSYLILPFLLFAIAEMLVSVITYSYVTRLSDIRYSSSIIGGIALCLMLGYNSIDVLKENLGSEIIGFILVLLTLIAGILILVFRKTFLKWSGGLD